MASPDVRFVITDTSILINFLIIDRLDLLTLPGYRFHISEHVVREITNKDQLTRVQDLLEKDPLRLVQITDPAEAALYASYRGSLGEGEAASLAIAGSRGWFIACDEKGSFLRQAMAILGIDRVLNTVSILVISILGGHLTVEDADRIKDTLGRNRFHIEANSFADLLPRPSASLDSKRKA